jgi:hypothetical protein
MQPDVEAREECVRARVKREPRVMEQLDYYMLYRQWVAA